MKYPIKSIPRTHNKQQQQNEAQHVKEKKKYEKIIGDRNRSSRNNAKNDNITNISSCLKMIKWSIQPSQYNLRYINTCAVDNLLFSLYYLVNRFPVAMNYVKTNVKSLYESLELMKDGKVDTARIRMIQTTDDIDLYPNERNVIDVTSTIGG